LSGDRFKTTSTTTYTLQAPGGTGTITVGLGLAYSVAQSIIIAYDANNHNEAEVTSYDPLTGSLSFIVFRLTGSGTYSVWSVNVDGASGGDGSSGSSGTSGTSATDGTSGTTGTSGSSGTSGTTGTSGSSGSSGTSAIDGTNGTSGTSGTTGTSGSSGTSGTTGTSGSSGTSGTSATNGTGGTSGTSGSSGTSGTTGTSGTSATSGTSGTSATSGTTGTSGTSGGTGTGGTSGTSGSSATSGTSGVNGATGSSGTSGTSVAVSGTTNTLAKFTSSTTIGNSLFTDDGTNGALGGANYATGTNLRSFNISSPLYTQLAFWANNVYIGDIVSYGVTGNLFLSADPANVCSSTKIVLLTDGTERFAVFNNGNVTIANSPTDSGYKLDVNGTGRFSGDISYYNAGNLNAIITSGAAANGRMYFYASATADIGFQAAGNSWFLNNLGIGTNNPSAKLHTEVPVESPATGAVALLAKTSNGANDIFRWFDGATQLGVFKNNGSVGINGVTNPAAELQVGKSSDVTIAMSNSSSVTSGNRGSIAWYNSSVSTVANIRAVAVTDNVGTELQFYTRPVAGSLTQVMTIASTGAATFSSGIATSGYTASTSYAALFNGNVGILTPTPDGRLAIRAQISNTPSLLFQNGLGGPSSAISNYESAAQTYTVIGTNAYVNNTANISRFSTSHAGCYIAFDEGTMVFGTGDTTANPASRMNISPSGTVNFLVTTRSPNYGILTSSVFRGGLYAYNAITGSGSDFGITIFAEGGTGNGNIYFCPNGSATRVMTINTSSNVLINTTSDSGHKLRVNGQTFTNELITLAPEAESISGAEWRFGTASIASITPNRRLRVKVGGVEYYIGAVEV
jgi:hypothetical protein